ncbi:uncharacterized protein LOC129712497 [Leucoraja erinacea]|uniref:uncharacterized protein LOC129712497 n=1 Tax=Leucoraja erinaceus TaxID=7782 RepID=UPI002455B8E0|nr:uncharacterized protein LOC129712497 [Leucoraja erinacea]
MIQQVSGERRVPTQKAIFHLPPQVLPDPLRSPSSLLASFNYQLSYEWNVSSLVFCINFRKLELNLSIHNFSDVRLLCLGVWLNSEASVLKSSKYSHHPSHTTSPLPKNKGTNFTGEVKRKQTADEIIQSQEKNCTSLYLLEEQQRLTLEREARLQMEINKLHKELSEQKQLLKENHDVMRQLQEQLLKVQSQQFQSNIQAERGHAIKSTAKPESKVCTVM